MVNDSPVLDRAFHALADSSRRSMVARLSLGPASVSELAGPLDMSLAAVLQHIQVLEASGLTCSQKSGRVRTCRLQPSALEAVERWVVDHRIAWEARLDRLGDHLQRAQSNEHHQEGSTP